MPEIDVLRSLAIAGMVAYHVIYDIDFLAPGVVPDPRRGVLGAVPPVVASTFLILAGVSASLAHARNPGRARIARDLRRVAILLAAAGAVSLATAVVVPDRPVRFGILHLLAVAAALAPLLVRLPSPVLLAAAAALIAARPWVDGMDGSWASLPLGAPPAGVAAVDYWPIVPWLAVFVAGVLAGRLLYPGAPARHTRPGRLPRWTTAPARHSLVVYLAHQPVLLPLVAAVLWLAGVPLDVG